MYGKVKLADLMKGAGWDWMKTGQKIIADQQLADMRKPDIQMSTRTRGGGQRKAGIGEGELTTIETQPEGDVYKPKDLLNSGDKEAREKKATKMADGRTDGSLPEQADARTPIDRGERSKVNADNVGDPNQVNELANTIQASKTAPTASGYDDILAMMRANTLNEGDMARRQHSREIVTGLGDLVSSIANLWATTKGAPNSYDNSKGMTATSQSRYDRELARRKAQNEQILNYYRVKKAAEDDERIRKYREDIDAREQRRLDEAERHNKEMERLAAEKEQNNKEAKAEEQERKNKDSENKRNNDNKRADAYVAGQNKKGKGSTKKSSKSSSSNTPPSRRRGNSNGNNTRPSKRK